MRLAIVIASLAGLAGCGPSQEELRGAARESFEALSVCLYGAASPADARSALRAMDLANAGRGDWPGRCPHAAASSAAREAGEPALASAIEAAFATPDRVAPLAALIERARAASLAPAAGPTATPVERVRFADLDPLPLSAPLAGELVTGSDLRMADRTRLCEIRAGEPDRLRCRPVPFPAGARGYVQIVPAADGVRAWARVASSTGEAGALYRGGLYDGARMVLDDPRAEAFVGADESLVASGGRCAWLPREGTDVVPAPAELAPLCAGSVRVVGDLVLGYASGRTPIARAGAPGEATLSSVPVALAEGARRGCRAGDRVYAEIADGAWVSHGSSSGVTLVTGTPAGWQVGCGASGLRFVRASIEDTHAVVERIGCPTEGACRAAERWVLRSTWPARVEALAAAPLGDRVLVAFLRAGTRRYDADAPAHAGIAYRVAEPASLDTTADVVLTDPGLDAAIDSVTLEVHARAERGWIAIRMASEARLVSVGAEGPSAVRVVGEPAGEPAREPAGE
ncbi:MAG: hypothetical protein IT378_24810 [Sandaracinaceae bacterium]|nr:hypothetical protein [Sandaracinaceae bacterium]